MANSRFFTSHYLLQRDGTLGPWPVVEMSDDGRVLSLEIHPEGLKERPGLQLHGGLLMAGLVDAGYNRSALAYTQRELNRHFSCGTLYLGGTQKDTDRIYTPPFLIESLDKMDDAYPFLQRDKADYQIPLLERIRIYTRCMPGLNWLDLVAGGAKWSAGQRDDLKDKGFVEPGNQCGLMVIKNLDLRKMVMTDDMRVQWLSIPFKK
jgi:hypothetical protein